MHHQAAALLCTAALTVATFLAPAFAVIIAALLIVGSAFLVALALRFLAGSALALVRFRRV